MPATTPKLIHPQDVVIEQLDTSSTTWDPHYREPETAPWPDPSGGPPSPGPVSPQYKAPVTLRAQVKYKRYREMESSKEGDTPRGEGHLLFSAKALTDAGITLQINDRCVQIGTGTVEYYIVDLIPMGHYDKPYFIKAIFSTRMKAIPDRRGGGLR